MRAIGGKNLVKSLADRIREHKEMTQEEADLWTADPNPRDGFGPDEPIFGTEQQWSESVEQVSKLPYGFERRDRVEALRWAKERGAKIQVEIPPIKPV